VSAQQPNLVQNGSFENSSNDFSSDKNYNTLVAGSTAITGWRVSSGEVDQVGNYWSPQEGSVSIDLSGGEPGAIEQNITGLEVGERYELTYYYRGQPKVDGPYDARVEVGDLDKTVTAVNPGDWTLATHNFTAGNTTETLTFTQGATPKSYAGMALDNVSIVESSDPIDTTAPNVSIDQPAGGATLTTSNVSLNVSANESGNWTYSVDGGPNQTATGTNGTQTLNVTLSGLADGSHTATVYIKDDGGNVDTDTVSFTISSAPTVTTSSGGTNYTASTGGFVVDENLTVTNPDGGTIDGATIAIGSGFNASVDTLAIDEAVAPNNSITSTNYNGTTGVLTLDGTASAAEMQTVLRTVTYAYSGETTASARDIDVSFALGTGGNNSSTPTTAQITVTVSSDTTAPSVTIDQPVEGSTLTTGDVAFDASANKTGNWTYSVDGDPNQTATGANGTQTLNETVSNLEDGSHTATVYIEDDSGTVGTDMVSFTISSAPTVTTSSSKTDYTASDGGFIVDDSLTVTSPDDTLINGATVAIGSGFGASEDTLAVNETVASNNNITNTNYNSATGVLTLDGTASADEMQTVLRAVTYTYSGDATASARDLDVSFALGTGGNKVFDPTTDHYYEHVSQGKNFDSAKTAAAGNTHLGQAGYLTTITGQAEHETIVSLTDNQAWIGAESTSGDWKWVTGPEANDTLPPTNTPDQPYQNWDTDQPDASGGYAHINFGPNGEWNDLQDNSKSYIVEYGGLNGSSSTTAQRTLTVDTEAPTLTTSSGSVTTTTASGGYLVDDKLTVTDPDGGSIDNATVSIDQGFDPNSDKLSVNTTVAANRGITSTYDDTTGVLNVSANSSATVTADTSKRSFVLLRTISPERRSPASRSGPCRSGSRWMRIENRSPRTTDITTNSFQTV